MSLRENLISSFYDNRRIFIFDVPHEKTFRLAINKFYNIDICQYYESHLIAICETEEKRNDLISKGEIKIHNKSYKVGYGSITNETKKISILPENAQFEDNEPKTDKKMIESFLSFEYDDRRIFIFDIPFDDQMKEALRLKYTLENFYRYKNQHLIAICNEIHTRNVLIVAGKIEIKGKKYKVFGWLGSDGEPMTRTEYIINKAQEMRIQEQKQKRNESECKKRYGRGRGLLANLDDHDSFPDIDELNINDMTDSNKNSISKVITPNDYISRVEKLCPGYFSNNDMAGVVDEKEKQLLAESIVNEFPELFREFTEDELKICRYPDMSLQDEVMRLTDELLTRECERARPKPRVALRMKFTDEEEELLVCIKF